MGSRGRHKIAQRDARAKRQAKKLARDAARRTQRENNQLIKPPRI